MTGDFQEHYFERILNQIVVVLDVLPNLSTIAKRFELLQSPLYHPLWESPGELPHVLITQSLLHSMPPWARVAPLWQSHHTAGSHALHLHRTVNSLNVAMADFLRFLLTQEYCAIVGNPEPHNVKCILWAKK